MSLLSSSSAGQPTYRVGAALVAVVAVGAAVALAGGCKRTLADGPAPRPGTRFSAPVWRVTDGDTFSVKRAGKRLRVRLYGVDAPERHQRFGGEATRFLREHLDDKTVDVQVRTVDRYGRAIAVVRVAGDKQSINRAIVAAGLAWWYRRYARGDKVLAALEHTARRRKLGLWADPHAVPPWHFRRAMRHRRRFRRRRRRH